METNNKYSIFLIFIFLFCLSIFPLYPCKIAKDDLYIEIYNFLVKKDNINEFLLQKNSVEDVIEIQPVNTQNLDFSREFVVCKFKYIGSSDTYNYVLIKFKDDFWIFNTRNVGGILKELLKIKSGYQLLNYKQIIDIIEKVQYPQKQIIEKFGNLKFVSDR